MENKDYENSKKITKLLYNEINNLAQSQHLLKSNRKKDLGSKDYIIKSQSLKITFYFILYRWVRHFNKYWDNRGINNISEYIQKYCHDSIKEMDNLILYTYMIKDANSFSDEIYKILKESNSDIDSTVTLDDIKKIVDR